MFKDRRLSNPFYLDNYPKLLLVKTTAYNNPLKGSSRYCTCQHLSTISAVSGLTSVTKTLQVLLKTLLYAIYLITTKS